MRVLQRIRMALTDPRMKDVDPDGDERVLQHRAF